MKSPPRMLDFATHIRNMPASGGGPMSRKPTSIGDAGGRDEMAGLWSRCLRSDAEHLRGAVPLHPQDDPFRRWASRLRRPDTGPTDRPVWIDPLERSGQHDRRRDHQHHGQRATAHLAINVDDDVGLVHRTRELDRGLDGRCDPLLADCLRLALHQRSPDIEAVR